MILEHEISKPKMFSLVDIFGLTKLSEEVALSLPKGGNPAETRVGFFHVMGASTLLFKKVYSSV